VPACGEELFRAQDAAVGHRRADRRGRARQQGRQGLGSLLAADAAQGFGGGRRDVRVGTLEFSQKTGDRLGVAADAEGIDCADQQASLQFALRLAQRILRGRVGNRFQSDARPRGQLRISQQGGQGRDRVLRAADGQALAGDRLLGRRSSRLEQLDQLALLVRGRNLGLGRRAGGHDTRQHHHHRK
jgi:hypothetical protein